MTRVGTVVKSNISYWIVQALQNMVLSVCKSWTDTARMIETFAYQYIVYGKLFAFLSNNINEATPEGIVDE